MAKEPWRTESGILSNEAPASQQPGEISDAARDDILERARKLRVVKYRLIFIFLLLPFLLVAAIVFDWVWEMNLSGHMTRTYVLALYGGLTLLFILAFCVVGYLIRKRMQREDEEMLKGAMPTEMAPSATAQPRAATREDKRSRH